jgi:hypothetical protein
MMTVQDIQGYVHHELARAVSESEHIPDQLQAAHDLADTARSEIEAARDAALTQIAHLGAMLDSLEHQVQHGESTILTALGGITRDVHALMGKLTAFPDALNQFVDHETEAAAASMRQLQGSFQEAATGALAQHTPPTVEVLAHEFPTLNGLVDHVLAQARQQVLDASGQARDAIETAGRSIVPDAKQKLGEEVANGHRALSDALTAKTQDLVAVHSTQHGELSSAIEAHNSELGGTHEDAVERITDQLGKVRNVIDTIKPVVQIASLI